jgi:hypothetical protein
MNIGYTVMVIFHLIILSRYAPTTGNMTRIMIEIAIKAPVTPRTTSGFTFTPLVSSSKNLSNPALEAGKGAFFFLLLNSQIIKHYSINSYRLLQSGWFIKSESL